ncbi:MAG: bifunctional adenosylcobinamide kinase/adenosylcobinamide-phosphate guanylyltransferase [Magnetococcus sp. XQGC-1]
MHSHLILGGVRSGKSAFSLREAEKSNLPVLFVATAEAKDAEMQARITDHQKNRPAHWQLREEPLHLGELLMTEAHTQKMILVDCLTLWLTNLLLHPDASLLQKEQAALLQAVEQLPGSLILVNNETGLGVIPMGELTRRFVDANGTLNQQLAARCARVTWVVAGLPTFLKGSDG